MLKSSYEQFLKSEHLVTKKTTILLGWCDDYERIFNIDCLIYYYYVLYHMSYIVYCILTKYKKII